MALLRRSSTGEDCEQDEDALLKSTWSLSIFPELKYSEEQELVLLGKWLQVKLKLPSIPDTSIVSTSKMHLR